jgi:hypothetical protein
MTANNSDNNLAIIFFFGKIDILGAAKTAPPLDVV